MKKTLLIACAAMLLGALAFAAPEPIGSIIFLRGKASATGVDKAVRPLKLKSTVFANDRVVTAADSRLQIMCLDDSVISLGANSEMTIDEYVYDPKQKEGKCVMDLIKGLFRVVTGKITEMNPERFKTKTKLATIGIRGCELGFKIEEGREDIFIMHLPRGHSVLIERSAAADELKHEHELKLARILTIVKSGVAVELREGAAFRKRAMTADDARLLFIGAAAAPPPERPASDAGEEEPAVEDDGREETRDKLDNETPKIQENRRRTRTSPGGDASVSGPRNRPPANVDTPASKVVLVGGSPFEDWEWAIWDNGDTEYHANRYAGAAFLTDQEYQQILRSGVNYNLNGTGSAGAVVMHAGKRRDMQGRFKLNVVVGQTSGAWWDGQFELGASGANSLKFDAAGPIDNAQLSGGIHENRRRYELIVDGKAFGPGSISYQRFNGRLIHPPANNGVISAGAGLFKIDHSGQAMIHGAFGAQVR